MAELLPGVPYTDTEPDDVTEQVSEDRDDTYAETNGQPKNPNGVAVRPAPTPFDTWLTKVRDQTNTPTPADPLKIITLGSSISGITNPTFTGHRPWPLLLNILGSADNQGWRHATGNSDSVNMDSTTGTVEANATAGWGASLDAGEYCTVVVASRYLHVVWTRKPSGGDLEVRTGIFGENLITTIDTDGTARSGMVTEVELTPNIGSIYSGTVTVVAAGANAVLDGIGLRNASACAHVVNAAHSGFTGLSYTGNTATALDYIEQNDPDCTIVMLGANDGPSNLETRLRALVEDIQERTDNLVVLVGEPTTAFSATFTNAMSNLVEDIASEYDCLFIDVNAAAPTFNTTHSGDALHPSQSGHQLIADMVSGVLTGDPIGRAYATAGRARAYTPTTAARWPLSRLTVPQALDHLSTVGNPAPCITAIPAATSVTTGDGKAYWRVPSTLNGRNLVGVGVAVFAPSSSGTPTVQIARGRQAAANSAHVFADMLSTRVTLDVGEYDSRNATTPAVINASNDDVATGDLIRIDVDTAGTGTTGLFVTLEFA